MMQIIDTWKSHGGRLFLTSEVLKLGISFISVPHIMLGGIPGCDHKEGFISQRH